MKSWRGPPSEAARAELNAAEGAYAVARGSIRSDETCNEGMDKGSISFSMDFF
jgi:hypothetical protein